MAKAKGCTPGQLALAWVIAQGDDVVVIPGTKRIRYLEENIGAEKVKLTKDDLVSIDAAFPAGSASGQRYSEQGMASVGR
jgi:aryl-alcohol dehydrogenase-like predicted oxidoreductase